MAAKLIGVTALKKGKNDRPPDWSKMVATIKWCADNGVFTALKNELRCKSLQDVTFEGQRVPAYELKTPGIRMCFFICDASPLVGDIVITHAFKKKRNKTPPGELDRLAAIYGQVSAELKTNQRLT